MCYQRSAWWHARTHMPFSHVPRRMSQVPRSCSHSTCWHAKPGTFPARRPLGACVARRACRHSSAPIMPNQARSPAPPRQAAGTRRPSLRKRIAARAATAGAAAGRSSAAPRSGSASTAGRAGARAASGQRLCLSQELRGARGRPVTRAAHRRGSACLARSQQACQKHRTLLPLPLASRACTALPGGRRVPGHPLDCNLQQPPPPVSPLPCRRMQSGLPACQL